MIYEDEIKIEKRISKCPEIIIKFNNNISVAALVDTGSAINGLSEEWFNQNKQYLEPYEELNMTNTPVSYTHLDVYKRQVPYKVG